VSEGARPARDYAEVSLGDLATRYLSLLGSRGRDRLAGLPMTPHQALERIAVSEAISRYVRDGRQVDILAALNAGVSWKSVADVLDAPVAELRSDFRCWVYGQRALFDAAQQERPRFPGVGLSPEHADAALRLADSARATRDDYSRE